LLSFGAFFPDLVYFTEKHLATLHESRDWELCRLTLFDKDVLMKETMQYTRQARKHTQVCVSGMASFSDVNVFFSIFDSKRGCLH
jgi:hypothetical protein